MLAVFGAAAPGARAAPAHPARPAAGARRAQHRRGRRRPRRGGAADAPRARGAAARPRRPGRRRGPGADPRRPPRGARRRAGRDRRARARGALRRRSTPARCPTATPHSPSSPAATPPPTRRPPPRTSPPGPALPAADVRRAWKDPEPPAGEPDEGPVRLLPAFDEWLLGWASRDLVLPKRHADQGRARRHHPPGRDRRRSRVRDLAAGPQRRRVELDPFGRVTRAMRAASRPRRPGSGSSLANVNCGWVGERGFGRAGGSPTVGA